MSEPPKGLPELRVQTSQRFSRIERLELPKGSQKLRGLSLPEVSKKNREVQTSQRFSRTEKFEPHRSFQEELRGLNFWEVFKKN